MSHVFVDLSNIASIRDGKPGYAPWKDAIRICEAWIAEHPADSLVLVVDWGFYGYLEHHFPDELRSFAQAKAAQKVRFAKSGKVASLIEAPEGVPADEYLLRRANRYADRVIIAEDNYRPYRDDYPWLQGFELQLPVFEQNEVQFEPLLLRPIDDFEIEFAEERDGEKQEALAQARAARRNRHQRRQAAKRVKATGGRQAPQTQTKAATSRSNSPKPQRPAPHATQTARGAAPKPAADMGRRNSMQRNNSKTTAAGRKMPIWAIPMLAVASIAVSVVISRLF